MKKFLIILLSVFVLFNTPRFAKRIIIQNFDSLNFYIFKKDITKYKEKYFSRHNEYREIGNYIKLNSREGDRIYSQRPEVYLTSERFSITRYFSLPYMYIEKESKVYNEFFSDFKNNKPIFIVINKEPHRHNIFKNVRESLFEYIDNDYIEVYSGKTMRLYKLK